MEPVDSARFPWLFVGGKKVARNEALLARHGIVYIVNCTPTCGEGGVANFHEKLTRSGRPVYSYLRVPIFDTPSESLSPHFALVWDFIERCRWREDGNLLIHCKRGVSRSVAMLCSYFIRHHDMDPDEALALIRKSSPLAKPNDSFRLQLKQLRSALLRESTPAKRREVAGSAAKRRRVVVGPCRPPVEPALSEQPPPCAAAADSCGEGEGANRVEGRAGSSEREAVCKSQAADCPAEESARGDATSAAVHSQVQVQGKVSQCAKASPSPSPSALFSEASAASQTALPKEAAACRREGRGDAVKVQLQKC